MDKEKKISQILLANKNTLSDSIGLEITNIGDDFVCGKIPVDNRTKQPWGLLHGGASLALAETLGSIAGSLQLNETNKMIVGVEINANHLKSVKSGWVYGTALPIKIGKKLQIWEVRIIDDNKQLICISRLTLAVIHKK